MNRLLKFVRSPLGRILAFILMAAVLGVLTTVVARLLGWTAKDAPEGQKIAGMLLRQVGSFVVAYVLLVRWIERRPLAELVYRHALRDAAAGAAGGVLFIGAVIATVWLAGAYTVTGFGSEVRWAHGLLVAGVGAAVGEEILFRGVLFRITQEGLGTAWAMGISALFFGGVHLGNPGATVWSSVAIAVEAGLLLGAVYHVTRSLPACMGVHFAWNVLEGTVFGSAVSGHAVRGSWLQAEFRGPDWLTGGSFGIEASVLTVAIGMLGSVALLAWGRRRAANNGAMPRETQPC